MCWLRLCAFLQRDCCQQIEQRCVQEMPHEMRALGSGPAEWGVAGAEGEGGGEHGEAYEDRVAGGMMAAVEDRANGDEDGDGGDEERAVAIQV